MAEETLKKRWQERGDVGHPAPLLGNQTEDARMTDLHPSGLMPVGPAPFNLSG